MIFIGDVHGNFARLASEISRFKICDEILIQVGDFGIGFGDDLEKLTILNNYLKEFNNHLYVIRGNHDDPLYFKGNYNYSNLHLLADYSILNFNGLNFLFVGGAISIDRIPNQKDGYYWKDEEFVLQEIFQHVDVLVTHTAPSFCYPHTINNLVLQYSQNDKNLLKDLEKERALVTYLFNSLSVKYHFYGHFHSRYEETIGKTRHILLNIMEFKEFKL